jgi:hypothetical protein
MNSFSVSSKYFRRLKNISRSTTYMLLFEEERFSFTPEQLILISPHAFEHCSQTNQPFIINLDSPANEVKAMINSIQSLFINQNEIQINHWNYQLISKFAQLIQNKFLIAICDKYENTSYPQSFSFSQYETISDNHIQ